MYLIVSLEFKLEWKKSQLLDYDQMVLPNQGFDFFETYMPWYLRQSAPKCEARMANSGIWKTVTIFYVKLQYVQ